MPSDSWIHKLGGVLTLGLLLSHSVVDASPVTSAAESPRERININAGWRFNKWSSTPDGIV